MSKLFHSVKLNEEKCKGCSKCMNNCPMEAVRIKNSKAFVIEEKCIDCGECIKVCPYNAHEIDRDYLEDIQKYKIKVAVPSTTLYAQFGEYIDPGVIHGALLKLGFDEVYEQTYACDIVAEITKKEIEKTKKPAISLVCPSIARLISINYPSLIENTIKVLTPIEVAANLIREKYEKAGYKYEDVGIFFLTPCAVWLTSLKYSSLNKNPDINGVIAIKDIYSRLLKEIKNGDTQKQDVNNMSFTGLSVVVPGGLCRSINSNNYITVDGVKNVIKILDEVESGKLKDVDLIEPFACSGGCLGGSFLVENPYNARRLLDKCIKDTNFTYSFDELSDYYMQQFVENVRNIKFSNQKLAEDFVSAVKKMKYMNELVNTLPGTDCGRCGSPSCKAFAEDVVRGLARVEDCKYINLGGDVNEG
jgi:iron only hydrogenase large subunit-like protein